MLIAHFSIYLYELNHPICSIFVGIKEPCIFHRLSELKRHT